MEFKKAASAICALALVAGMAAAPAAEAGFKKVSPVVVASAETLTYGDYQYEVNDGTVTITGYTGTGGDIEIPATINGKKVTRIGNQAFSECYSLTSVVIPDGVTSIGTSAFDVNPNLKSVSIPDSVTSIGSWAFSDCTSLTSITIPNSVTSIDYGAFYRCTSLTSIIIPNSVTSIDDSAFSYCESLTSITIPDSVTSIDESAFSNCTSLTSINVENNNVNYCSVDGVLFNKDKTNLIKYPTGKEATSYTIPNSVISIGLLAFSNCTSLTSITIPNSVTSIGKFAFASCTSLTTISIPDSVTSIGWFAFFNCTSLTSITIPNSVTSIGEEAFSSCSSLTDVYYCGTKEQWKLISIDAKNELLLNATIHYDEDILFFAESICKSCLSISFRGTPFFVSSARFAFRSLAVAFLKSAFRLP